MRRLQLEELVYVLRRVLEGWTTLVCTYCVRMTVGEYMGAEHEVGSRRWSILLVRVDRWTLAPSSSACFVFQKISEDRELLVLLSFAAAEHVSVVLQL